MFAEWVAAGAIFGIKAFFAVATFAICGGTLLEYKTVLRI